MHPRDHLIHIVWWDALSSDESTCLSRHTSFQAALSGAFQLPAKEGNDHVATMPGRRLKHPGHFVAKGPGNIC